MVWNYFAKPMSWYYGQYPEFLPEQWKKSSESFTLRDFLLGAPLSAVSDASLVWSHVMCPSLAGSDDQRFCVDKRFTVLVGSTMQPLVN